MDDQPIAENAAEAAPVEASVDPRPKLIDVRKLSKTFTTGMFRKKKVLAVKGVTFDVRKGRSSAFWAPMGRERPRRSRC